MNILCEIHFSVFENKNISQVFRPAHPTSNSVKLSTSHRNLPTGDIKPKQISLILDNCSTSKKLNTFDTYISKMSIHLLEEKKRERAFSAVKKVLAKTK